MTPERWQRINALFGEALRQGEAERAAFLDRACAGDASLRAAVARLLEQDALAGADDFLGAPCPLREAPRRPDRAADEPRARSSLVPRRLAASGRGTIVVSLAAALVLLGSLASVTALWLRAGAEVRAARDAQEQAERLRQHAEEQQRLARRAVDAMYTQVAERLLAQPSPLTSLQIALLRNALDLYQVFAKEESTDPESRLQIAQACRLVGRLHSRLGNAAAAEQAYRRHIALLEALTEQHRVRFELFQGYRALAGVLQGPGQAAKRSAEILRAHALIRDLVRDVPEDSVYRDALAQQQAEVGHLQAQQGQLREALASFQAGVAVAEALLRDGPDSPGPPRSSLSLAVNLAGLAGVRVALGQLDEAEVLYRRAVAARTAVVQASPAEPSARQALVVDQVRLALVLTDLGRADEAAALLRPALEQTGQLARDFPDVPEYYQQRAEVEYALGTVQYTRGLPEEAAPWFRRCLEEYERQAAGQPESAARTAALARLLATCPDPEFRNPDRAVALARRACLAAPAHQVYPLLLGIALCRAGDWQACVAALEGRSATDAFHGEGAGFFLAMAHGRLGNTERARACLAEASHWLDDHPAQQRTLGPCRQEAANLLSQPPAP